jgi:hypothetical protein
MAVATVILVLVVFGVIFAVGYLFREELEDRLDRFFTTAPPRGPVTTSLPTNPYSWQRESTWGPCNPAADACGPGTGTKVKNYVCVDANGNVDNNCGMPIPDPVVTACDAPCAYPMEFIVDDVRTSGGNTKVFVVGSVDSKLRSIKTELQKGKVLYLHSQSTEAVVQGVIVDLRFIEVEENCASAFTPGERIVVTDSASGKAACRRTFSSHEFETHNLRANTCQGYTWMYVKNPPLPPEVDQNPTGYQVVISGNTYDVSSAATTVISLKCTPGTDLSETIGTSGTLDIVALQG